MQWMEKFPRKVKPVYEDLLEFMPPHVRGLFLRFDSEMAAKYKVYNNYPRYEKSHGWAYGYCRNYRVELLCITIGSDCFNVLGVAVRDEESLTLALEKAGHKYAQGYEQRYAQLTQAKKENQIIRAKASKEREKAQLAQLAQSIDASRLNKCKWSEKVRRDKLVRLYQGEAKGLLDEALLDDIGFTFYARCAQARDTRLHLDKGEIICHHCGAVLKATGYASLTACPCGYYYTYREYRRSCNANSLPGGRATEIFNSYADNWPKCKTSAEKMLLIDGLVHQCHISAMTGGKGRSVCVNLLEGSAYQIKDTLETLAGNKKP